MPLQPAVLGPNLRLNNFRLNYLTADQAADRPTHIRIILGGIDITQPTAPMRMIYKSMQIRDALFEAPNTCAFTIYGAAPNVGQPLEVWINSNDPVLLFGGELQTVDRTYKGRPGTVLHPVTAIDDTARANRRRPLRPYVNTSATAIAQDLIATYAPGFSSAGVEAGLPNVSINFDGSEGGMKGCLTALAKLIGGYWYFENKTLYLFVTPPGNPPDPIDDTPHRFLHEPAITWSIDKSQVRTRVYGKGASTRIVASLAANTDRVPLENAEMFNATGGQAIAGRTPDGAASRVVTYTGVQLGGGGGLVGPGAAPSSPPALALLTGLGMDTGAFNYAVSFATASGESLPSPIATITTGPITAPTAAPVPSLPTVGGAIDDGAFQYAVTFVTASGETTSSNASNAVTIPGPGGVMALPATAATIQNEPFNPYNTLGTWAIGDAIAVAVAYMNGQGVTTIGPVSNSITIVSLANQPGVPNAISMSGVPVSTDPAATQKRIYIRRNGVWGHYTTHANSVTGIIPYPDPTYTAGVPPATNTAGINNARTIPITGIQTGPANVTARKLYRWVSGVGWRLVTTIANNTATTYTDAAATASLSGSLPASNTALANQVAVTIAVGNASVTARKIYRTLAGQASLRLLATIANNTQTSYTDATADGGLGATPPPAVDTSGLTQPSGQVPAGSTSLILANAAPFAAGGGWAVIGNGEQVIRYTGTTANSLTGIPASGPGSIVAGISYNSTVTAAPALVGVAGLVDDVIRNAPIHVWVQRDDLAAQSYMAALDGSGDGVYEHIWSDERRTEASLIQVCDAQLALYSRPLVTVVYASRDLKTKSGKTVTINLATPAINESLTIQDVAISEIGIAKIAPKFTATASTARQSFESILQMLIRKADA
jgi:hypothetical protein